MRMTWSLPLDFCARIAAIVPGVAAADMDRLAAMFAADLVLDDDGVATAAFVAWVAEILRRGGDAAMAVTGPSPVLSPSGMAVSA